MSITMASVPASGRSSAEIVDDSATEESVVSDDAMSEAEAEHDPMGVSLTGGSAPDVQHPCSESLMVINDRAEWLLSGAKPGNGVECLVDGDVS